MSHFKCIAVALLLHCVLAGLGLPRKGHHHRVKGRHHHDKHGMNSHDSQHHHKKHSGHHYLKHRTTVGAQRGNVPSPLQDFVLVSGSPLFHERPRSGDGKINATEESIMRPMEENKQLKMAQTSIIQKAEGQETLTSHTKEEAQQPKQEEISRPINSKNTTATSSLTESGQIPENGTAGQAFKPFKHPSEYATAGLNEEKSQENPGMSTINSTTPPHVINVTLHFPKNSSSEVETSTSVSKPWRTSEKPEASSATMGGNNNFLSNQLKQSPLSTNLAKTSKEGSTSIAPNGNQTSATNYNSKPEGQQQSQNGENFPFNIPGIRNFGNDNARNEGAKLGKHLTDNLGPNCHWKITEGKNGENVTSLSCSGEFSKSEQQKFGFAKYGNSGPATNITESKESPSELLLLPKPGGDQKEKSDQQFQDEALSTINEFRKIHRSFNVSTSSELSRQAMEYAKKIANMGSLQHDFIAVKNLDEGENLAMGCKQFGIPLTAKEAITNWYNEVCDYDFDRAEFSMSTGHFTQVVWAETQEFGIGKAAGQQNGMPCTFVVGRFKPSGNYKGEYKKNVFKGKFDQSYCDKLKYKKLL